MRLTSRFWYLVSMLCFVAAVWFWLKGNEEAAKRKAARGATRGQPSGAPPSATGSAPQAGATQATGAVPAQPAPPGPQGRVPSRLSNTDQPLSKLGRSDAAILLDNAFIDTANRRPLEVPRHLRAKGDPGSYIVQSSRPLDPAFYGWLREAGAEFVSYIPNDAGLVRVSANGARQLAGLAGIRAVLPYEPYYKLAQPLLPLAVEQQSLPPDWPLQVTLFPGGKEKALAALRELGAEVTREERTPFGPMLTVSPHPDSLVALAQLPEVQRIEYASGRTLLNDLSRTRLQVSADTFSTTNYLGLTGADV